MFNIPQTAGMGKWVRSMRLYHSRQCCIVLKPRSDYIDYMAVCFMMHDFGRKLWTRNLS